MRSPHFFAEALRRSGGSFPVTRWKHRGIAGPSECQSDSYDAGPKDPRRAVRLWGAVCFPDPKTYYEFLFVSSIADARQDTEDAVEWIVRSFEPELGR